MEMFATRGGMTSSFAKQQDAVAALGIKGELTCSFVTEQIVWLGVRMSNARPNSGEANVCHFRTCVSPVIPATTAVGGNSLIKCIALHDQDLCMLNN